VIIGLQRSEQVPLGPNILEAPWVDSPPVHGKLFPIAPCALEE